MLFSEFVFPVIIKCRRRQLSMHYFRCNVNVTRRFKQKSMDSDSDLQWFPLQTVTEAALPDVDGLRLDDANLAAAVAAGAAGKVEDASVLAPRGTGRSGTYFCN